MKQQLADGLGMMEASDRGGTPPDALANGILSLLAPLSSVSLWMTHPEKERVLHVELGAFADGDSDEDKAARGAVTKVTGGADRNEVYSALASEYGDEKYKARAGDSPNALGSAVTGAFFLGVLTSVGYTSFLAYEDAVAEVAAKPPASP
jgi:hypothetical protein